MTLQPSVRLRLTLLYGGLFVLAGAVLLAVNYALVRRGLERQDLPVGLTFEAPATAVELPPPDVLITPDGRTVGSVLQEYQTDIRNQALRQVVVQSALALGVMGVASVAAGWAIAGRVLRPLQQITATARRLSDANLHERLALEGPQDELKELADTFDAMLERLEAAFDTQRRFVANASHELRTPLAIQRTLVDVALADPNTSPEELRAMAVAVRDAVDRSEHLVDSLLVLARSEGSLSNAQTLELAALARAAVDQYADEAGAKQITVTANLSPASVDGHPVLLERLVANLLQNALRHNHQGGWVEVATGPGPAASVQLTVRNSGPIIAQSEVATLFEPFRRLAPDRVGSTGQGVGLGLSIVKAVATAHRGSVEAAPIAGGGLSVTVTLPVTARAGSGAPQTIGRFASL